MTIVYLRYISGLYAIERRKMSKKISYRVGEGAAMPYMRQKSVNVSVSRDMMPNINPGRIFSNPHIVQTPKYSKPADNSSRVLLIEDNKGDEKLIREMLIEADNIRFDLECFDMLSTGLERLAKGGIDVVLLDLGLPDSRGFETFSKVQDFASSVPIVILTGITDEELALNAVRKGAQDYLLKNQMNPGMLTRSVRYAIERKRADKMLQKNEDYFRMLIENSRDIIMALDADGTIQYASPSVEWMLGYISEEVAGKKAMEFIHPDDALNVMDFLSGDEKTQDINKSIEFRIQHKDGSWRILEGSGKRIPDEPGTAFVVNAHDITARKKAERVLKESDPSLRSEAARAHDKILKRKP